MHFCRIFQQKKNCIKVNVSFRKKACLVTRSLPYLWVETRALSMDRNPCNYCLTHQFKYAFLVLKRPWNKLGSNYREIVTIGAEMLP